MTICLFDCFFRVMFDDMYQTQGLKSAIMLVFMSCFDRTAHDITTKLMYVVGNADLIFKTMSVSVVEHYSHVFDRCFKNHIDDIHDT